MLITSLHIAWAPLLLSPDIMFAWENSSQFKSNSPPILPGIWAVTVVGELITQTSLTTNSQTSTLVVLGNSTVFL